MLFPIFYIIGIYRKRGFYFIVYFINQKNEFANLCNKDSKQNDAVLQN